MSDLHDHRHDENEGEELEILRRIEKALEKSAAESAANLPAIELDLNMIAGSLADIVNLLTPRVADRLKLTYLILGGSTMGAPVSMSVGNTASPSVVETAVGSPVAPIGPLVFASDNPAVASVDPSTGVVTGVSAGTANISVIDQGNGLTDSVAFTISAVAPPPADALSLSYTINPTGRR